MLFAFTGTKTPKTVVHKVSSVKTLHFPAYGRPPESEWFTFISFIQLSSSGSLVVPGFQLTAFQWVFQYFNLACQGWCEHEWPAQHATATPVNIPGMNWNSGVRPPGLSSVLSLTNALVAECKQIPTAMLEYLVESILRRVKAILAAKGRMNVNGFWNGMLNNP